MAFTVGLPDGPKDYEYEAYVSLLEAAGIDLANTSRLIDPKTGQRWLHAWNDCCEAEKFANLLKANTSNPDWEVYELPGIEPSEGPLGPVVLLVGRQSDGYSYNLTYSSQKLIKKRFPNARLVPNLFVSSMAQHDFESEQGPIWGQIATILSGLSEEQLEQLGGFQVYDPASKAVLQDAVPLGT